MNILCYFFFLLIIKHSKYQQNIAVVLIAAVLALVKHVIRFVCVCKYCLCHQKAEKSMNILALQDEIAVIVCLSSQHQITPPNEGNFTDKRTVFAMGILTLL